MKTTFNQIFFHFFLRFIVFRTYLKKKFITKIFFGSYPNLNISGADLEPAIFE